MLDIMRRVLVVFVLFALFFSFYTLFWLYFFKAFPFTKKPQPVSLVLKTTLQPTSAPRDDILPGLKSRASPLKENVVSASIHPRAKARGFLEASNKSSQVLSVQTAQKENNELPKSYRINILSRKQSFNLSCEFAAAASIIYHFKNDPAFSVQNEYEAEKILMAKVGISQNPNVGIRMGNISFDDFTSLFTNLNKLFGGTEYYGVHAPPFIDLFEEFDLSALPIKKENEVLAEIKKAISQNHLVMAWTHVGYGESIDVALSYGGSIPLVRGEHTVVVNGYDEKGFLVMDPGSGRERNIPYDDFLAAIKLFPMPLLAVYPGISESEAFEFLPSGSLDSITGLKRDKLRILIKNASKKTGLGNEVAAILKEFGYKIVGIESQDADELDVSIKIKKEMRDYLYLLKRDLNFLSYRIATVSSDLNIEDADAILTIGR